MTPEEIAEHKKYMAVTRNLSKRAELLAESPDRLDQF
jgi:hypothetical protein